MATGGLYKLDDGEAFLTNCFPVRSFFQPSKEGAGHWLVAQRNAIEEKYRSRNTRAHCTAEESVVSGSTKLHDSTKTDISCNTLDRSLLMRLHCVDKPSALCNVNISDQKLHSAKPEDFEEFDNVAYINASENHLNLEPFNRFPILRELELSLNRIYSLRVNAGDFPHLEVLDLSYNHLSSDDVLSVGLLPCLKVLHLTGNGLQTLPDDMASPLHDPTQWTSDQSKLFTSLEVLMLDDNNLCCPGVFNSLANLKRLQYLNLQGNYITEVPFLQQFGDTEDLKSCSQKHGEDLGHGQDLVSDSEMWATSNKSVERTDADNSDFPWVQKELNKNSTSDDYTHRRTHSTLQISSEFNLPLPELRFLNLADNKIAVEEALLAVAWFPSLTELVIHSNPLTTQRSGDPPMLTHFLHDRLGVSIRRQKTQHFVKPRIVIPVNQKRKVETKIRKVPKVPLSLEAASSHFLHGHSSISEKYTEDLLDKTVPPERVNLQSPNCPPHMSCQGIDNEEGTDYHGLNDSEEKANDSPGAKNLEKEAFFLTQVNDLDGSTWQEESERQEPDSEQQRQEDSIPDKFRGYEILLDAKPDPFMFEPVGIQQTVRVLELALKNLLVYRDSKANTDLLQKPYTEKEKRIGKLLQAKPRRLKGEKAEDALTKIKDRRTINKVPLDKVLKGKDVYKKEYEEAWTLLKDMKKKYKIVHMKAEESAQVESSEHTNLDGRMAKQE
ncbi:X-ray radiation resistance-associated protein 1 isoform X1 [Conger conger]|uniref:X-ray radiation resistance-associated protein 1 isoform X1 n=1 Tax=Conger conger TaxID=82655 RepID=UPI002A5A32DB|nr:X-ray radiation resistance-associated protein 1 isoform X1 [Conger conger]